jgi:hypothetical protein
MLSRCTQVKDRHAKTFVGHVFAAGRTDTERKSRWNDYIRRPPLPVFINTPKNPRHTIQPQTVANPNTSPQATARNGKHGSAIRRLKGGLRYVSVLHVTPHIYIHIHDIGSMTNHRPSLHDTEEHSDCKVICGPYRYNIHKTVLVAQSEYFRAALKPGNFKVIHKPMTF